MRSMIHKILFVPFFMVCFCTALANDGKFGTYPPFKDGIRKQNIASFLPNDLKEIALNINQASAAFTDEVMAAASDKTVRDSIETTFRTIATNGTWIDNITDNITIAAPFGMRKVTSGTTYEIAFAGISFFKTGAVARVFARSILPQKTATESTKTLYFAGFVSLARGGGIISDGKLFLVGNDAIPVSDQWSLLLNGITQGTTGSTGSATYFKFDCNGFTEMGIKGNVLLSNKKYTAVDPKTFAPVTPATDISAPFETTITKWGDLFATNLKFSGSFSVSTVPGYIFTITAATLDFSESRNPTDDPIKSHIQKVQSVLPNTWRGLSITGIDAFIPKYFYGSNSTSQAKVSGTFGAIDDNGFTVKIAGSNLLDIKSGSANGWPISVEKFNIYVFKNAIVDGSFSGKLVLPIEDKSSDKAGISYKAEFNEDGTFYVTHGDVSSIKADMWKGYLVVDPSFELSLALKGNVLIPKISLSGKFNFHFNGNKNDVTSPSSALEVKKGKYSFGIEDASFEELVLQTEKPYISVKSLGTASQLEIGGFSADVSVEYQNKRPVTNDANAEYGCLHFDANVQLMDGKIGGGTGFDLYSKYDTVKREWVYDSYKLTQIKINAEFGKVSFKGSLDFMNDTIYGKGFNGIVILKVSTIEIGAGAMFGTKTGSDGTPFKYWNVDAYVKGLNINFLNIIQIQGFSGGATYKMDPIAADKDYPVTLSGVSYVPNENSFLRVRAGIFLSLATKTVVSGWGGLEIVFNKNWGVDEFSISGNVQFFSLGIDEKSDKNKITPLTKGSKQTRASRMADAAAKTTAVKAPKTPKPVAVVKVVPKITSAPIVDKSGKPLTTKKGKPLVSKTTEKTLATTLKDKSGKTILDKNGKPLESTTATKTTSKAALDKKGNPLLDGSGDPIMVNTTTKTVKTPVLDSKGNPVLDAKGDATYDTKEELIKPKVMLDAKGKVMLDKKGNPIVKYKIKDLSEKEEEGGGGDDLEFREGGASEEEAIAAQDNKPNAADSLTNLLSDYLVDADNPDITDVAQQLLLAKTEMEKALTEKKIADAKKYKSDSVINLLNRVVENLKSSGSGGYINTSVQEHNWVRNSPEFSGTWNDRWPIICSLLNIPYINDDLVTIKKGNYSIPTQAKIDSVQKIYQARYLAANEVYTPALKAANNFIKTTFYLDCKSCAENWVYFKTKCNINPADTSVVKLRAIIADWKKKYDSLSVIRKTLEARRDFLKDSAYRIGDFAYELKTKDLIDYARRELNYYNNTFQKRSGIEDSLARFTANFVRPNDSVSSIKNAIYNDKLNIYNPLFTKFNSLTTIEEANRVALLAKAIRVKLLNEKPITATEKAILRSSDSLNALAANYQDNLNKDALSESSKKISQNAETKSAMAKSLSDANTKLAQLKQSAPNSQEYKNALQLQQNAQTNLDAFNTQVQQDSSRFRQDSALISNNIIVNNGGPVITVTAEQLDYINKKYTATPEAKVDGSELKDALYIVNNPDAASIKIFSNKSNSVPKVAFSDYGRYMRQPSEQSLAQVKADENAVIKALALIEEADNAKLDVQEKAEGKSTAVMPIGTRPDGSPPFWGNFIAKVDLKNEALSFNMDVYASLETKAGTLFAGKYENSRAGSGEIYFSKGAWHIYLGTKENPMGIIMKLGSKIDASIYFEASNTKQADGSDIVIKHGLSLTQTFNWSKSFAFAEIKGGISYDILIKHKDNFICSSTQEPAGMYGWYGKGKVKAYLEANAGVNFWGFKFTVLSAGIYADLEIRAPNPVYFKGSLLVTYSVGWSVFSASGSFTADMETGTYCRFDD